MEIMVILLWETVQKLDKVGRPSPLEFSSDFINQSYIDYVQTAEAFARTTGDEICEELTSMRNRQEIQKLVLEGKIGEAINTTNNLYPGLLTNNQDLLFRLKVYLLYLISIQGL